MNRYQRLLGTCIPLTLLFGCGESGGSGSPGGDGSSGETTSSQTADGSLSTSAGSTSESSATAGTTNSNTSAASTSTTGTGGTRATSSTGGGDSGASGAGGNQGAPVESKSVALTDRYGGCVIDPESQLNCWGWFDDVAPTGIGFHSLSAYPSDDVICALDADNAPHCFSSVANIEVDPAPVQQVAVGNHFACLLGADDHLTTCWLTAVTDALPVHDPPETPFAEISVASNHGCGIGVDGTLSCWGTDALDRLNAPTGQFVSLATGNFYGCAIASSGSVACWGGPPDAEQAPDGSFIDITAADEYSCAVTSDGALRCWGAVPEGLPEGQFRQVVAATDHACAVAVSGSLVCWGDPDLMTEPPEGIVVK